MRQSEGRERGGSRWAVTVPGCAEIGEPSAFASGQRSAAAGRWLGFPRAASTGCGRGQRPGRPPGAAGARFAPGAEREAGWGRPCSGAAFKYRRRARHGAALQLLAPWAARKCASWAPATGEQPVAGRCGSPPGARSCPRDTGTRGQGPWGAPGSPVPAASVPTAPLCPCRGSAIAKIAGSNAARLSTFENLVSMWVLEEEVGGRRLTEIINTEHENVKYLPGHKLPPNVVSVAFPAELESRRWQPGSPVTGNKKLRWELPRPRMLAVQTGMHGARLHVPSDLAARLDEPRPWPPSLPTFAPALASRRLGSRPRGCLRAGISGARRARALPPCDRTLSLLCCQAPAPLPRQPLCPSSYGETPRTCPPAPAPLVVDRGRPLATKNRVQVLTVPPCRWQSQTC